MDAMQRRYRVILGLRALQARQQKTLMETRNLGKTPWWELPTEGLRALLVEEFEELTAELDVGTLDSERIAAEATDLANICMFICDVFGTEENDEQQALPLLLRRLGRQKGQE